MMLQLFKNMLNDIRVINALSLEAERQARLVGLANPGAEHYLLAALALEEGSARRAMERVHANPAGVRAAIAAQHKAALAKAGIGALDDAEQALESPPPKLFDASASGKALVKCLPKLRRQYGNASLRGAHVLLAVTAIPNSTAARSLVHLGADLAALAAAAEQELAA
jgi:hypothetical protein